MRSEPNVTTPPLRAEQPEGVRPARPRARRYAVVANVELTDLESEKQVYHQLSDLSLFGCRVTRGKMLSRGAKIRIRIMHGGTSFNAVGVVVHARLKSGMGIVFTGIENNDLRILENWICELRTKQKIATS